MLAFIVGLKSEARLLSPLRVRAFAGGGSARGATLATKRAIESGAKALVSFGLAGGLSPNLHAGDIVIPAHVIMHGRPLATDAALAAALGGTTCAALLAGDAVVGSVAGKAERWADMGADAVDLESGAVAEAARRANLPFAVLRAVCDPADRTLPPAAYTTLNASGAISLPRLIGSLLRNPGQIPDLLSLSREAAQARRALAGRVAMLQQTGTLRAWS